LWGNCRYSPRCKSIGDVFVTRSGIQSGIKHLDISTNTVTEWLTPQANSGTRGIAIASSGTVYFIEESADKIGRLVPSTNTVTEWSKPSSGTGPQEPIIVDSMENVFFQLTGGPVLNRLVPSTNIFTEWSAATGQESDLIVDSSDTIYFGVSGRVGIIT